MGSVQNPESQNPERYEIPKNWPALSLMLPGIRFSGFCFSGFRTRPKMMYKNDCEKSKIRSTYYKNNNADHIVVTEIDFQEILGVLSEF